MKIIKIAMITLGALASLAEAQNTTSPSNVKYVGCEKANENYYYTTNDGYIIIDGELREDFPELNSNLDKISEISNNLRQQGIILMPLILPIRPQVVGDLKGSTVARLSSYNRDRANKNYAEIIEKLNSLGIPTPDLVKPLLNKTNPVFFRGDHHITPYGARIVSEEVGRLAKKLNLTKDITKENFVTKLSTVMKHPDPGYSTTLSSLCEPQQVESFELYKTEAVDSSMSLLDEDPIEAIYVGTSMGRDAWNLAGFLKQNLQVDINDQHIEAGGTYTALANYLMSKEFIDHKPKIIMWEWSLFETFYDREGAFSFNNPASVNYLAALSTPKCRESERIKIFDGKYINGQPIYIKIPKEYSKIKNLRLNYNNLSLSSVSINYLYASNSNEINFTIPNRITNKGILESVIPSAVDGLVGLKITLPEGLSSGLVISACK